MPLEVSETQIPHLVDADGLTLGQRFIAWVRKQPVDQEYNFYDVDNCPAVQFTGPWTGIEDPIFHDFRELHILFINHLRKGQQTFGALADRLSGQSS